MTSSVSAAESLWMKATETLALEESSTRLGLVCSPVVGPGAMQMTVDEAQSTWRSPVAESTVRSM